MGHTKETKKKISKALKKRWKENPFSKEHLEKLSKFQKERFKNGLPEEIKIKISKANKGRKFPYKPRPLRKGKPTWNKGKKGLQVSIFKGKNRPEIAGENSPFWRGGKPKCKNCGKEINYKKEICHSCFLKEHKGEKHWNWRGGITPENKRIRQNIEYRLWRESVFARDNWTCQKCIDNKGGNLNAHHIQNLAQYRYLETSINNGITFCKDCHKEFHKKYGYKNNTKEQLEEFLSQ